MLTITVSDNINVDFEATNNDNELSLPNSKQPIVINISMLVSKLLAVIMPIVMTTFVVVTSLAKRKKLESVT